jgi:hypothetical protein
MDERIRERLRALDVDADGLTDDEIRRDLEAFEEAARSFGIGLDDLVAAFAHIGPADALGFRDELPRDTSETLVDLARAGDEATFRDLARAVGVAPDQIDALWRGTLARASLTT